MAYELITDLSESRTFRTRFAIKKFTVSELTEFYYAVLLSHLILAKYELTDDWAEAQFSRAAAFSNFEHFRVSINDLYSLTYILSEVHPVLTKIMQNRILRIYRMMGRGIFIRGEIEPFTLRLERMINIDSGQLRMARRSMIDWDQLTSARRQTVLHHLKLILRKHSLLTEVLPFVEMIEKEERKNV